MQTSATPALLASLALVAISLPAAAQPVCEVPFEVYLTDALGVPVEGALAAELRFYGASDGEPALDCRTFPDATVEAGWLCLPTDVCGDTDPDASCGVASLQELVEAAAAGGEDLAGGVTIVEDAVELAPRFSFGGVPYSLFANVASRAETATVCSELDGFDPTEYVRFDDAIDADTLDSLDFVLASDPIDADRLEGLDLAGVTNAVCAECGGGGLEPGREDDARFWLDAMPREMLDFDEQIFTLTVAETGTITGASVDLSLLHADTTELQIALTSPAGTEILLHESGPGGGLACSYDATCGCPAGGSGSSPN